MSRKMRRHSGLIINPSQGKKKKNMENEQSLNKKNNNKTGHLIFREAWCNFPTGCLLSQWLNSKNMEQLLCLPTLLEMKIFISSRRPTATFPAQIAACPRRGLLKLYDCNHSSDGASTIDSWSFQNENVLKD